MAGDGEDIRVQLRVYGHLVWYLDEDDSRKVNLSAGVDAGDLMRISGVPTAEVSAIMINGRRAGTEVTLRDGDCVEFIPVLSGG